VETPAKVMSKCRAEFLEGGQLLLVGLWYTKEDRDQCMSVGHDGREEGVRCGIRCRLDSETSCFQRLTHLANEVRLRLSAMGFGS